MAAGDVSFYGDALPLCEPAHLGADLGHRALEFVADDQRHLDGLLRPGVPVDDVQVGPADRRVMDAHQQVVRADRRLRDLFHPDARLFLALHEGLHETTPSSRPTLVNAATARSRCAGSCAAESWTRIRA